MGFFFSLSLETRTLSFLLEKRAREEKEKKKENQTQKENTQNDSELRSLANALYVRTRVFTIKITQGAQGGVVKRPRTGVRDLSSSPGSAPNYVGGPGQATLLV